MNSADKGFQNRKTQTALCPDHHINSKLNLHEENIVQDVKGSSKSKTICGAALALSRTVTVWGSHAITDATTCAANDVSHRLIPNAPAMDCNLVQADWVNDGQRRFDWLWRTSPA